MLWWLLLVLYGDVILALTEALSLAASGGTESPIDPDYLTFIKDAEFMFPENFLSRYPEEANPFRLKIFAYLIFNLLVKGYGSVDPSRFWLNYNRDDFNRAAVDAVFYEYLTKFTDREVKDLVFNPLENTDLKSDLFKSVSNEEFAVDRIGQYIDLMSETESRREMMKMACDICKPKKHPEPQLQIVNCDEHIPIQTSGIAGIDYPNFCDIPKTSFSCADKSTPGIYADYETGCQAFHVCWLHRKDSFLCPIGTIFNQSHFTCDVWHDASCYSSPLFHSGQFLINGISTELDFPKYDGSCESLLIKPLRLHTKFLPAKCEVKDILGHKVKPRDEEAGEFKEKLEVAYNLIKEMLQILKNIRSELDNEMKSKRTPKIYVLEKYLNTISNLSTETAEIAEFTRKLGETDLKPPKVTKQERHSGKLASWTKPDIFKTSSTFLRPSKPLEEHIKSSRKQYVPEIVMRSLTLGGTILNEGVIPLAKQVMIDSYRKIEFKKR